MTLLLLLVASLAVPAWAQKDRIELIRDQHARISEEADLVMERVRTLRDAYPTAPGREQALAERQRLLGEAERLLEKGNRLRVEHRHILKGRTRTTFAATLSHALNRRPAEGEAFEGIFADETAADEMHDRAVKLDKAIARERKAVGSADLDLQRRRRLRTRVYGGLAAAVFVLLALAIVAPWRTAAPVPPAYTPPALLGGNFELGPLIGRGAMGEVFAAQDTTLNRRVALKRMRPELLAEPKDRERFLSEARLVAALKHPNIVAIHSVVQEGGETYLVFEFVDGKTLEDILRERGRVPWSEALALLESTCSALAYAHSKGVIHRDLKPSNIMLTAEGALKVMDFGIAHQARVSASRMTRATSVGTLPYMAPEQELGGVSARVDLYAATVCFYEMLTGRLPFSGPNFLAQKREEVYEPASSSAPGLPPGIDAYFKAALSPQPSKRPKDAAALYAAAAGLMS